MKYPPVTVAMLIYQSPAWLSFALEGLIYARNRTPMRVMVVGNDANNAVMATGRVDIDHRNEPGMKRMERIYSAWNRAVKEADTEYVCLMNSDMAVSDYWLDSLVATAEHDPLALPCSLLVESGRIPSAMPEHVKNFGTTPDSFDWGAWEKHAASIAKYGTESGRLYMPVLVRKSEFFRVGGYPFGNPAGTTGDKDLFARYAARGFKHLTVLDSVVAHIQCGEAEEWYGDD